MTGLASGVEELFSQKHATFLLIIISTFPILDVMSMYSHDAMPLDVDECASNPCLNGACTDDENLWECACEPGWTGEHCETGMVSVH